LFTRSATLLATVCSADVGLLSLFIDAPMVISKIAGDRRLYYCKPDLFLGALQFYRTKNNSLILIVRVRSFFHNPNSRHYF